MDVMTAKLFHVEITGERRDTETVMRRLEGDWKVPALVTRWSPTHIMHGFEREGDRSPVSTQQGGNQGKRVKRGCITRPENQSTRI